MSTKDVLAKALKAYVDTCYEQEGRKILALAGVDSSNALLKKTDWSNAQICTVLQRVFAVDYGKDCLRFFEKIVENKN